MINLDKNFLTSIGIEMDDEHYALFVAHIDETLNKRIEDAIIHTLTPEKIHELAALRNADEGAVWQWLQTNVPNLGDIVKSEVDAMLTEVVRTSDHL